LWVDLINLKNPDIGIVLRGKPMPETLRPTCVRMCLSLKGQMQNVFVAGWILLRLAHRIGGRCKRLVVGLQPVLEVVLDLLGWRGKSDMA
jgi:hypothetical protein